MTVQALPPSTRIPTAPAPMPAPASTPKPQCPAPHQGAHHVDLSQGRELGTRQWWRLYAGRLRHERKLFPCRLVQRILYKRKAEKQSDAATLLNYFFKSVTIEDGPSCITLARHYAHDPAHRKDALDLYRAAETAGAMRDVDDVLCMAQLLVAEGHAGDAVGLIAGHKRLAPNDVRLATWTGVAWTARACEASDERPEFFASAQQSALKALRLAATLSPSDAVLADNIAAVEALYPGPNFGNIARKFSSPFTDAPNLREALIESLENRVNYVRQRTYMVGTAVRVDTKHHRRQENVDAVQVLRQS